ncbi:MAG: ORF6N domain-containing protein [Blastocatellia bacterium]|nr:ORF6N domain-containing protein [Blastocatellia bacterium]
MEIVKAEDIEQKIYLIRGQRVMIDSELAEFYQVETRVLNQAVKRNLHRFPEDFMFQLSEEESKSLTSQSVMSNEGRGGRRTLPNVFTEHGAVMLASVLNSPKAIEASIQVVLCICAFESDFNRT